MPRPEQIPIQKHITQDELQRRIKILETNAKILKRLYFIKYRYEGSSVEEACSLVGVAKPVGYIWQERWNEDGYEGLIPRYAGGRPSKLNSQQKGKLVQLLKQKDVWTTDEVKSLIRDEFGVEYTLKQIRIIVRKFGMKYAKPFTHDYRRPDNAEEILKKTLWKLMKIPYWVFLMNLHLKQPQIHSVSYLSGNPLSGKTLLN
jgi:transposase